MNERAEPLALLVGLRDKVTDGVIELKDPSLRYIVDEKTDLLVVLVGFSLPDASEILGLEDSEN